MNKGSRLLNEISDLVKNLSHSLSCEYPLLFMGLAEGVKVLALHEALVGKGTPIMIKNFTLFTILPLLLFIGIGMSPIQSEPWLSNRYAQNCAACHAPGRWNLEPKERRCTLSCQGCHVNPNGGGLRNSYGRWTQERWLKSFHVKSLSNNKLPPAPLQLQTYGKKKWSHSKKVLQRSSQRKKNNKDHPQGPKAANTNIRTHKNITNPKLKLMSNLDYDLKYFDKNSNKDWKTDVKREVFVRRLPKKDPWRLERDSFLFAGADLRYFFGKLKRSTKRKGESEDSPTPPTDQQTASETNRNLDLQGLMNVDVGLRFRPIQENLSLVIENRFSNGPSKDSHYLERGFTSQSRVRSAYLLIDDVFYNSWVMVGLYRPMFGYYSPDHESLSNQLTGFKQNTVFKSLGIGTAPNVPFANLHLIMPTKGSAFSEAKGINLNVGARFVTYSLSLKGSYWFTREGSQANRMKKTLYALAAGAMFGDAIFNLELVRFKETHLLGANSGNVYTIDTKYRIWRENYMVLNLAQANIALNKGSGESSELGFGYKGYLFSGLKIELLYITRKNKELAKGEASDKIIQGQIHYFF